MGDCREGVPCDQQPPCTQCEECPPPGAANCFAVPNAADPNNSVFYPWDSYKQYQCKIGPVAPDGTATVTVVYPRGLGENVKQGVRVITDPAAIQDAKEDRKTYLKILDKHLAKYYKAYDKTGKPYPKHSYMADDTGQFIFMPAFYDDLDCPCTVIKKTGNTAHLSATYNEGRGWSKPKNVHLLKTTEQQTKFIALRFEFCGGFKAAKAAAQAEYDSQYHD